LLLFLATVSRLAAYDVGDVSQESITMHKNLPDFHVLYLYVVMLRILI